MATLGVGNARSTRAIGTLRIVAVLLSLSLMIGECWRSWGVGRPVMFVLDDQLIGGFLIAAAWAMGNDTHRNRAAFSAAWGMAAGMLYGSFFKGVIFVDSAAHPAMHELTHEWHEVMHNAAGMALHSLMSLPLLLAASGVAVAWFFYMKRPDIPASIQARFSTINKILENKYGFDSFNERVFAAGSVFIGNKLWQIGDVKIIDGAMVNGTANLIGKLSGVVRKLQTGLIYHYAFAMIIGVFLMLTFFNKV